MADFGRRVAIVMPPDVVAPIQSVTATSIMGWGGFIFGFIACAILVWREITGRGRSLATIDGKIEHLCEQVEDMEGKFEVVDGLSQSLRDFIVEWQGRDGDNGYRSIIRSNHERIKLIERRNDRIDAVREADERRGGGQQRRHMDRELNNLLPEPREEKG